MDYHLAGVEPGAERGEVVVAPVEVGGLGTEGRGFEGDGYWFWGILEAEKEVEVDGWGVGRCVREGNGGGGEACAQVYGWVGGWGWGGRHLFWVECGCRGFLESIFKSSAIQKEGQGELLVLHSKFVMLRVNSRLQLK